MARGSRISIDGKSSVDQNDWFPQQSKGSHNVRCDLDSILNWWDTIRPPDPTPEPIPVDEDGVPQRWCSGYLRGGHYSPQRNFNRNKAREDGLDNLCRQCRHELYEHHKATGKAGS